MAVESPKKLSRKAATQVYITTGKSRAVGHVGTLTEAGGALVTARGIPTT
jgi:hypothetical protein